MRHTLTSLSAVAVLTLGLATPAQALQPGWERGTVPTILGYPKCIATKSAVRIYGVPRTKPGAVCAVRVWRTVPLAHGLWDYARANKAMDSWEWVGVLYANNGYGEYVADLVRRPG